VTPAIRRLLVANRGEIAVRIIRAARDLGIATVAVTSAADRHARHPSLADQAICLGPGPATASYLRAELLLHTAVATGCDAVHPGYGFLSEDADFAARVRAEGLTYVGASAEAIAQMGDKAIARSVVARAGVPVVPGSEGVVADAEEAVALGQEYGFPVLLKARAGGGGKGMRIAQEPAELAAAFVLARQEAVGAFGDGGLYVEKYLQRARHVEVQVLADTHGHTVHLGERDCSIQRRHQKVFEEAPSPIVDARLRSAITGAAVRAAEAVGYHGAGTVEFLVDLNGKPDTDRFYFIEMNTRIQVEHGLTEELTGIDLVTWQLRIAAGQPLDFTQTDIQTRGHAIECRINAEDPAHDFAPSPGTLLGFEPPAGPGVRVDTHCFPGAVVPPYYDSLLAKLVVYGRDRPEALCRARRALAEFHVEGLASTVALHRWLLDQPGIVEGDYTTESLASWWMREAEPLEPTV